MSGLRNPPAAVRGVGAAALGIEALVLLLAIAPLVKLGGRDTGPAVGLVLARAVVPVALLAGGFLQWSLAVLGVVFGVLWGYVLYVRRIVLSGNPS
jgi:hypothetical protein